MSEWDGGSPWLFLVGLVVFLGSGLLFLADLIRGIGVIRSVGANAAGAALLIAWAAQDTYANPDSEVASAGGAAGTALLLYGLYLVGAGAIIALTGLVHEQTRIGVAYLGLAVLAVVGGYLIFPKEAVLESEETTDEQRGSEDSEATTDDGTETDTTTGDMSPDSQDEGSADSQQPSDQ